MAGKSFALVASVGLCLPLLAGCPSNIGQNVNSGKDSRSKGAKKIGPDGANRWRSKRDVVTYPGGDRIDWKVIEIPEETPRGDLSIKIKFDLPRPGLDVAFDVFDTYFERVGRAKPSKGSARAEQEMAANTKRVKLQNVGPGKYYVMIYAPTRTDAARYRVSAKFVEKKVASAEDTATLDDIPLPPKLPAIPEPVEAPPIDPNTPPQPQPCPNDPSRMQPDCEEIVELKPVNARIRDFTVSAQGGIVIKINKGSNAGIAKKWKGVVVDKNGRPIEGGDFVIFNVTAKQAKGKVKLSVDQVNANKRVIVSPN